MGERVAGPEIERLIQLLARLPGLGPRSARRAALHLIKQARASCSRRLPMRCDVAREKIVDCRACGNVDTCDPCTICAGTRGATATRSSSSRTVADLWALERAGVLNARYHVLGGTLSPLDGIGPERLNIASLVDRVAGRRRQGGDPGRQRHGGGPDDGALHHGPAARIRRSRSRGSRMACRSAASSTISTKARWPPRSAAGQCFELLPSLADTGLFGAPCGPESFAIASMTYKVRVRARSSRRLFPPRLPRPRRPICHPPSRARSKPSGTIGGRRASR